MSQTKPLVNTLHVMMPTVYHDELVESEPRLVQKLDSNEMVIASVIEAERKGWPVWAAGGTLFVFAC